MARSTSPASGNGLLASIALVCAGGVAAAYAASGAVTLPEPALLHSPVRPVTRSHPAFTR